MVQRQEKTASAGLGQLAQLGRVAGVPGIALGLVALIGGGIITATSIPTEWRGPIFVILAGGVIALGLAALWTWSGGRAAAQIAETEDGNSAASNRDKTRGGGGKQVARTKGKNSPAINERS